PDPEAEDYALRAAVAGRRAQPRSLRIERVGQAVEVHIKAIPIPDEPAVSFRRLDGGVGYIRISTFSDDKAVAAWDQALAELRDARGLILDARRNGGGDPAVARPTMGRLGETRTPHAHMRPRRDRRLVAP